ncbi:pilus assembly protein TadG [Rhizobium leguminosarum]|uniref:Pilus assembly protein TadG n=2 Tax=Rhizobium leguminosarum TaxID=384 RepID=A0A4V1P294_RHILE|nr:TadE/TadG family type IV pilus assembly protein [Rhizobium leguminosarum]RXT26730.1 pilus assembly protein TadG [Rhizobium leguminosarum]
MMSTSYFYNSCLRRLLDDRRGNFGMMTAIMIPVLLGAAGLAIDYSNMALSKRELQEATDSAALAAATALANEKTDEAGAKSLAKNFVAGQMAQVLANNSVQGSIKDATNVNVTTTANGTKSKIFKVDVNTSFNLPLSPLMRVFGKTTQAISATSTGENGQTDTQGALSMYLVLDRSGSMSFITDQKKTTPSKCDNYTKDSWPNPDKDLKSDCYTRKIEALQTAAAGLFTELNKADPEHEFVRVGAVSYTDKQQAAKAINWGTADAANYVSALPYKPTGGTDASDALDTAYKALKSSTNGTDTETRQHESKNHDSFQRYIILMTDGEMTGDSSFWSQPIDKEVRDLCTAVKGDGITIFTIAFMAPQKGKDLLQACASSTTNYYAPDNMAKLVEDFGDIAAKATSSITRLTN